MTKQKSCFLRLNFLILFFAFTSFSYAQEKEATEFIYKNQFSTNVMLPIFESVDINYERTIANKWALGLAFALYGERGTELSTSSSYNDFTTNYEVMPFIRVYFQGAQNKSHFVELFGSISQVEELDGLIRSTTNEGFGVYTVGVRTFTVGGLGAGYGYRFLFLEKKLVLEAQFGVRTNFDVDYLFLNGAVIRTGIRVGYRF